MKIRVKLYASLAGHLPPGSSDNQAELDLPDGATPTAVISHLGLPGEMCHLVLVNGVYVAPDDRATQALAEGDALAVWPPVAGG